jgi:predicted ATPase
VTEEKIAEIARINNDILEEIKNKRQKMRYYERLTNKIDDLLFALSEEFTEIQRFEPYSLRKARMRQFVYYVPAGRGGLIESFDTIVDNIIYVSPLAPVRGLEISPLPGMAAQFFSVLRELGTEKSEFARLTSKQFKELLDGEIRVSTIPLKKGTKPIRIRMIYRYSSGKKHSAVDLIHAASMVKEIAPIYLLIQQLLQRGQFLIVEEPESHLHPGAQCKFAAILAMLSKEKVNVFLTTHSTIVLRKIAHSTGSISGEQPILNQDDVAMYWLKEGENGSIAKPIGISQNGTLDEIPTFDEVINELFEEDAKLHEEVEREERGRFSQVHFAQTEEKKGA